MNERVTTSIPTTGINRTQYNQNTLKAELEKQKKYHEDYTNTVDDLLSSMRFLVLEEYNKKDNKATPIHTKFAQRQIDNTEKENPSTYILQRSRHDEIEIFSMVGPHNYQKLLWIDDDNKVVFRENFNNIKEIDTYTREVETFFNTMQKTYNTNSGEYKILQEWGKSYNAIYPKTNSQISHTLLDNNKNKTR